MVVRVWKPLVVLLVLVCGTLAVVLKRQQTRNLAFLPTAEDEIAQRLARATPAAPPLVRRSPGLHQLLGRIEIPGVHISVPIVEGADDAGLKMGAAHIIGTAYPGDAANVGIAAHRDTYFRALSRIAPGEEILIETPAGIFRYRVSGTEVVRPTDVRVLQSAGRPEMTLVTCYPFYYVGHAPKRFIVHARFVSRTASGLRG